MRRTAISTLVCLVVLGLLTLDGGPLAAPAATREIPSHHLKRGFRNLDSGYSYSMTERTLRLLRRMVHPSPARGAAPAVLANDGGEIRANGHVPTITWIGHSTFLVQIEGYNILTDPHWGDRASPVGFVGPRRLVAPGIRLEDLPPIDAVVISHDHYDHLDADTVKNIASAHPAAMFFVPLGVKALLADMGVARAIELDWWESAPLESLTFVCTPAQHSSGRGLHDQNLRLWSSWAIVGARKRFFFAGDTGYTPTLREIGQRLGPFDVAAIPIGGYSAFQRHHPNHVNPEEALQVFEDVRGRLMVPMHWGTFNLNREPFREPPDRLLAEALRRGLEEQIALLSPGQTIHW